MSDLSSLLVVCNFTQPWYANVPFLEQVYRDKKIVFYGDEVWDAPSQVIKYNQSNGAGSKTKFGAGFFAYRALLDAVQRFPDFDGYLFIMDDVLLRSKTLALIDPLSVYTGFDDLHFARLMPDGKFASDDWAWWKVDYAGTNSSKALAALIQENSSNSLSLPNHTLIFHGAASDLMYLPKAKVSEFLAIFERMSKALVFTEIAFPTGVQMMDCASKKFRIRYLWNDRQRQLPALCFRRGDQGIHPMKLSSRINRLSYSLLVRL